MVNYNSENYTLLYKYDLVAVEVKNLVYSGYPRDIKLKQHPLEFPI